MLKRRSYHIAEDVADLLRAIPPHQHSKVVNEALRSYLTRPTAAPAVADLQQQIDQLRNEVERLRGLWVPDATPTPIDDKN